MRVLFIGGTGNISTSVSKLAIQKGIELFHLNRGKTLTKLDGVQTIIGDIYQPDTVREILKGMTFDVVVNWIAYSPHDVENDISLFRDIAKQYIFVSSASAYHKPPRQVVVTESTPLHNPYMEYSRNKADCETRLMQAYREENFPVTIVRPSHTYAQNIPNTIGGGESYVIVERLLKGLPLVVHGDGTSLWTVTHAEDFAKGFIGLMGNPHTLGQSIHITSDESLTWNQIHEITADALGVKAHIIHMPSDFIARVQPSLEGPLLGDKTYSVIFDNSKLKSLVPDFKATIPYHRGIHKVLAWFDANEAHKQVSPEKHAIFDDLIQAYGHR